MRWKSVASYTVIVNLADWSTTKVPASRGWALNNGSQSYLTLVKSSVIFLKHKSDHAILSHIQDQNEPISIFHVLIALWPQEEDAS